MHLDNYGLKAIRAVYFEKLRLYEDSTKYANDVDVSRSHENVLLNVDDLVDANSIDDIREVDYDFTPNNKKNKSDKFDTYKKYNDDIKKRIVKITGAPPKNNVHVGSIVFTLPDEFKNSSKKDQVDVFKNWLRFIGDRYGNENIIDCVLHFDETTPHGTVTIVPEAISRKTHQKTVSTASCFTLKDLHNLHKDCDAYFERIYGVEGLINNQKTIGRTKVAKQHLDAFKTELAEYEALTKQNNELKAENQRLQDDVNAKRAEYDKLDTDVKNKLNEANNKASGIIDKAKTKAKAEAARITQAADIDITNRKNNLDIREENIIARENKYEEDTKEFREVTYPNYKKDKEKLENKEKELNTREAELLQREYEVKTDINFFYNNTFPKHKKRQKELEEKETSLNAREKELNSFAAEVEEYKEMKPLLNEYKRYKGLHCDTVKLYKFIKTTSAEMPFPMKDINEFIRVFLWERSMRVALENKFGHLNDKEKPAEANMKAIFDRLDKDVETWEKQEQDAGFEPFG